jgi:hypothetical protein
MSSYWLLTQATAIATDNRIKAIAANASAFESFSLFGLLIGNYSSENFLSTLAGCRFSLFKPDTQGIECLLGDEMA